MREKETEKTLKPITNEIKKYTEIIKKQN